MPTLLVGGRLRRMHPRPPGRTCTQRIPGSRLAIIEDASHLCFTEQPEVFTSLVNTFLDRHDAARPAASS